MKNLVQICVLASLAGVAFAADRYSDLNSSEKAHYQSLDTLAQSALKSDRVVFSGRQTLAISESLKFDNGDEISTQRAGFVVCDQIPEDAIARGSAVKTTCRIQSEPPAWLSCKNTSAQKSPSPAPRKPNGLRLRRHSVGP